MADGVPRRTPSRKLNGAIERARAYVTSFLRVPEVEELIQCPLDALDALLLAALARILGGEGLVADPGPIWKQVEVE